jgi:hypothetical protein
MSEAEHCSIRTYALHQGRVTVAQARAVERRTPVYSVGT